MYFQQSFIKEEAKVTISLETSKIEDKGGGVGAYENNLIKCIQNSVTMKLTDTEKDKEEKI